MLGNADPSFVLQRPGGPIDLVVLGLDASEAELSVIGSKQTVGDREIWLLMVDDQAAVHQIAQAIGVMLIDDALTVMPPGNMPRRPSIMLKFVDGTIRHSRNRTFDAWVLKEADRIAAILRRDYSGYLTDIQAAARRPQRPPSFRPLPADFQIDDDERYCGLAPPIPRFAVDLSQSPGRTLGLRHHQVIERDYLRDRYMEHLTIDELAQRAADITANSFIYDDEGRISADQGDAGLLWWFDRLSEVKAEIERRCGAYPAGWRDGILRSKTLPGSLNPGRRYRLAPRDLPRRPFLVKYEQRRFLERALAHGEIRVSPASSFADKSLNPAMHDEELSALVDVGGFGLARAYGLRIASQRRDRIPVRKRVSSNYYVYCTSAVLNGRLLKDFDRDACMIIHDPDAFASRLDAAMREAAPGSAFSVAELQYYDPLQVNPSEIDVLTWKHFRFAYQHETRFAWVPQTPARILSALDLRLGYLGDIAELVTPLGV